MPSKLVEIQSIAHNEIVTQKAAKLEINFHWIIGSANEHRSVYSFGIELLQHFDELLESVSGVVHVLHHQNTLSLVVLGPHLCLHSQLPSGVQSLVGAQFHEVVAVRMLQLLDEVGIEHECALEHANDHQIQSPLTDPDLLVVGIDLLGDAGDNRMNGFLVVQQLKLDALVGLSSHKLQIYTIMDVRQQLFYSMIRHLAKFSFSYQAAFNSALQDPLAYWRKEAERIHWHTFPKTILRVDDLHFHKWFPDGKINITEQCLDVHLKDRHQQVAYFVQSPITNSRSAITYGELHGRVQAFAGALKSQFGIGVGDRVIIYMPMVIQSIIALLACARIGATHVVVFGGFSAHQLANRIVDSNPKAVILANAGKQPNKVLNYKSIVNHALQLSHKKQIQKIILQRPDLLPPQPLQNNQHDFTKVEKSGARTSPVYVNSDHPLYILYTSGTTGKPKGIVRDHGGTAVLLQHAMRRIYDMKPGGSMFCSSDIGWVLGHSFIIYAPLITGIKSVLFQGKPVGTPNPDVFWQIIDRNKIEHLYTSPTAIRTIRKQDSEGKYINQHDLSHLKSVTLVGQRCDIPTFQWVEDHLKGRLVNDCYWQTESGGPILSNYLGFKTFPEKPGSACKPLPGYNVKVINSATAVECKPNETGTVYLKQPMPPSFMLTILNNDDVFVKKYFSTLAGHYNTGDSGYYDEDGYFHIMAREDDVINTAGHRLSTGQMQEILMKHHKIAQAIVIGAHDQIKGEVPVAFVTIKTEHVDSHCPKTVAQESVKLIREHIGPVASFKTCHIVPRLPKTRSGKYLRHIVRKMCNKQKYEVPSTIEDIDVAHEMHSFVEKHHHNPRH